MCNKKDDDTDYNRLLLQQAIPAWPRNVNVMQSHLPQVLPGVCQQAASGEIWSACCGIAQPAEAPDLRAAADLSPASQLASLPSVLEDLQQQQQRQQHPSSCPRWVNTAQHHCYIILLSTATWAIQKVQIDWLGFSCTYGTIRQYRALKI